MYYTTHVVWHLQHPVTCAMPASCSILGLVSISRAAFSAALLSRVVHAEAACGCSPFALQVMGCALLLPLGATPDGARVAEIGAFCVDPVFRGSGRGDSLLDYVEQVSSGLCIGQCQ